MDFFVFPCFVILEKVNEKKGEERIILTNELV
jgi:hypothetical protein